MNAKRAFLAAAAALLAAPALALIQPLMMNFQGKLVNPTTGNPQNGVAILTFKIYNVPTGGAALWTEANDGVALTNGVFSVTVGSNTALTRDLFLGASAYLEVTAVSVNGVADGAAMTPRQPLVMAPYAFTANQLSDVGGVRLISDLTYSTFTTAGSLIVPAGVVGSSGSFTNGVTASSGTFTATGPTQASLTTSSGIVVNAGTLDVNGGGGITNKYGLWTGTMTFLGSATDPATASQGTFYYNTSSTTLKMFNGTKWSWMYPPTVQSAAVTVSTSGPTAAKAAAGTVLVTPLYLSGPMVVNKLTAIVTTALGAAGDVGVYNSTGGLVLNGGSGSVSTAVGVKSVAPAQTGAGRFLPPGQYYAALTWNSTTGVVGGSGLAAGLVPLSGSAGVGGGLVLPASVSVSGVTNLPYLYFVGLSQ